MELPTGSLERSDVSVLETQLGQGGIIRSDRERRQSPVPGDFDGRHETGTPARAVFSQCFGGIAGAGDRGADSCADANERLGGHGDTLAKTILVVGVDTQRLGESSKRPELSGRTWGTRTESRRHADNVAPGHHAA